MIGSLFRSGILISLGLLSLQGPSHAQPLKEGEVLCYKSNIKDPLIFYGNSMDTFTLYDGSKWKVVSGGPHEYVPMRIRNVFICPTEQVLIIDKRALSVEKMRI